MKKKLFLTNLIFIIIFFTLNYLYKDIGGRSFDALISIFALIIYDLIYLILFIFIAKLKVIRFFVLEILFFVLLGLLYLYETQHQYSLSKIIFLNAFFIVITIASWIFFKKYSRI
tara:strand:+ start:1422 stop:1766 length:345 start_codon:yes stop_codon:yes gene_type:complete